MKSDHNAFLLAVRDFIPAERIYTDPLRTLAYGTDASFYRLTPKAVIDVLDEDEVIGCIQLAGKHGVALTFRAAGTSLSGQAVTDSVLVRIGKGWRGSRISQDGETVSLQPGLIGAAANKLLAPLGRKIGPDPASIDSCMIGGIVANNSSGMCCGVSDNSYKTLVSARLILADGTVLDTGDAASRRAFSLSHPHILDGLLSLRKAVMDDGDLTARISRKFAIKNTTGYSLNALVDFDEPFAILEHLMVGSEGTLGFIAEVTYRTVVDEAFKASSLMFFPDVHAACEASALMGSLPVAAVELMDRASLRSVEGKAGVPADLAELDDTVCSLLVEVRAEFEPDLEARIAEVTAGLAGARAVRPIRFSTDVRETQEMWAVRKGILPSVGAVRAVGDTCIIEDVAVPLERLAEAASDLQMLFRKHGYHEAALFGHALDGNLHFVFNQNFGSQAEVSRYASFMDELCRCITEKYDGSLKAEHGTGRNIAPFVEMEWGREATDLMRRIKTLLDPQTILNPGVIFNTDPQSHIKDLKPLPAAHPLIDGCTECGFCEAVCPSRRLTLTPRQRITSWREICRLKAEGRSAEAGRMQRAYAYQGEATCAADGLCALRCPASINTGSFIKHRRGEKSGRAAEAVASFAEAHFGQACSMVSGMLNLTDRVRSLAGERIMQAGSDTLRVLSLRHSPAWNKAMPKGGASLPLVRRGTGGTDKVVYFPSCVSRNMGPTLPDPDRRSEPQVVVSLLLAAGYEVVFPENVASLCCGTVFASKGFAAQADKQAADLERALLKATDNGRWPVLTETSPCLQRMKETLDDSLSLYEPTRFVLDHLAERLDLRPLPGRIALHATCSIRKLGLTEALLEVGRLCSEEVILPEGTDCCGFAGDRGFTHPELNASALLDLRRQLGGCRAGYTTSRTCAVGLSLHGGIPYYSLLALVEEAASTDKT